MVECVGDWVCVCTSVVLVWMYACIRCVHKSVLISARVEIYICMCCIYVCAWMYVRVGACASSFACVCMGIHDVCCVCMCIHVCVCMLWCMHEYVYVFV